MTYEQLNDNQKRIFRSLKTLGYNISPDAIDANHLETIWASAGAVTTTTTTTTTEEPTTTTTTEE